MVVSHPNIVPHNQLVYVRLAELGWSLRLVVPARWRDEYKAGAFAPQPIDGLVGTFARVRIANTGKIQRHVYVTRPTRWLRRWRPRAVFLEQEPFAVPAFQWGQACERLGIPWGVQGDENLDRPFPWPARVIRRWTMPRVDFFAARSPNAGRMLERWGARSPIGVVPHTIPEWSFSDPPARGDGSPFTIGYAGRLVEAKGISDLLDAAARLPFSFRLLVVGEGELRERVRSAPLGRGVLDLRTGIRSAEMPPLYRSMDVLVLPSRTTPTWAEQFGKVLCEALLCGVPVVGSSSGEIPWVIETSGGGVVYPEGDVSALAAALVAMYDDPAARERFARVGREGVEEHFAPRVAARALDELMLGAGV